MSVKLTSFFPGLAAYFNGNVPVNIDRTPWDGAKQWRAFVIEKFASPFLPENKIDREAREAWVGAYLEDGDKAVRKAVVMEDIFSKLSEGQLAKLESLKDEVRQEKDIDTLVKEKFDSTELDFLVGHVTSLPVSGRGLKVSLAASEWREKEVIAGKIKEFFIDGVLSKNLDRKANPRESTEFTINLETIEKIKKIEEDAKNSVTDVKEDEKNITVKYKKFAKEVNALKHRYEHNHFLKYDSLSNLVTEILDNVNLFPDIEKIKNIEGLSPRRLDNADDEFSNLPKEQQQMVLKYNAVKNAVGSYLIERAKGNNVPYVDPTTQYFNFKNNHSKISWSIPTTMSVIGPRLLNPFYVVEAIVGGLARGICMGINSLLGKDSRVGMVLKALFAGPLMLAEAVTYGLSKLTTPSSWPDIKETLTATKTNVYVVPPRSSPDHKTGAGTTHAHIERRLSSQATRARPSSAVSPTRKARATLAAAANPSGDRPSSASPTHGAEKPKLSLLTVPTATTTDVRPGTAPSTPGRGGWTDAKRPKTPRF